MTVQDSLKCQHYRAHYLLSPTSRRVARRQDLRIAVTRRVHDDRQAERRARFLAKMYAPPSDEATMLPATPPESPALFHFTLPSPGMTSPLSLFQSLPSSHVPAGDLRFERVNFRAQMPTLEEISSHLKISSTSASSRPSIALPDFLINHHQIRVGTLSSISEQNRPQPHSPSTISPARWECRRALLTESNLRELDRC